jgi:hypothetical protein
MRQMEGEKFDLGIEVTFLKGRLKEAKGENEARTAEADALKLRMAKATQVLLFAINSSCAETQRQWH